jgi:septum site-determining protein MinD
VAPADEVIVITNPEVSAVRDADRIVGLLEADERRVPISLVINRVKQEMVRKGDMLSVNDVMEILAVRLLGVVPEDEQILVSSNRGVPLTMDSQKTPAGDAFGNIARRITGEKVPLLELEHKGGVLRRLARMFGASDAAS